MAKLARGSQRDLSYIKEVTPGVTPALPAMTILRNTGDSLILTKDNFQSGELRSDRAITDVIMGNKQTGGGLDYELSVDNFDDFIIGALFADTTDLLAGIKNGVTVHSYTIEKGFPTVDVSGFYQVFRGMEVNTLSLNIQGNAPVTGSLDFVGTGYDSGATSIADSTVAPVTGGIFDSYNLNLKEDGVALGIGMSLTLNINNNLNAAFALGSDTAIDVIDGRCVVDGSMSIYFENADIYDKFKDNIESSLEVDLISVKGGVTTTYTIELPRIKYTTADDPVSDEGAVTVTMNFQALQDDLEDATIKISKTVV